MRKPQFKIWYVIWVSSESQIFLARRSRKAAKQIMRDVRKNFPDQQFGMKRLIEQVQQKRRRSKGRKKQTDTSLPEGFTIRTKPGETHGDQTL